jgi:hypothetical protein
MVPSLDDTLGSSHRSQQRSRLRWDVLIEGLTIGTFIGLVMWYVLAYYLLVEVGRTTLTLVVAAPILSIVKPWWELVTTIGGGEVLTWLLFVIWLYVVAVALVLALRQIALQIHYG